MGESATDPEDGSTTWTLLAADGTPLCARGCPDLPFTTGALTFDAEVATSPQATGTVVPLAALGSAADGTTYVVDPDGTRIPVQVTTQDGSRAVVTGVGAGTVVRLFADAEAAQSAPRADATGGADP